MSYKLHFECWLSETYECVNFMEEFWHTKKSYHLVGNTGSTYKTCCTAQKQW